MNQCLHALFVLAFCLLFLSFSYAQSQDIPVSSTHALTGFTATQDKIFISRAQGSELTNIEIYFWGTKWPFLEGPPQEHDNGETIERLIQQAVADGQGIVLTCSTTSPSIYRASGDPRNATNERVMPSMEDQYAQRCAQVVERWPQITRVQIGNEFKGYWNKQTNTWDIGDYTRLYNKAYQAIKSVRPSVIVGGGYPVLNPARPFFAKEYNGAMADSRSMDAMLYWLKNAVGYDAVCLDGRLLHPEDFIKLTAYFRSLAPGKSIWWSEYYGQNMDDMRTARTLLSQQLKPGDIALWWASNRFPWQ